MPYSYSLEHVQTYLQSHFLTLSQLAKQAQVSECEIHDLVRHGCIPGPTYFSRASVTLSSPGIDPVDIDDQSLIEYFHPSTVDWVRLAEQLASESTERNLLHLASLMRFHFESEFALALKEYPAAQYGFEEYFVTENEISRAQFHQKVLEEWTQVLRGTYGKCLRIPVTARNIVHKGVISARILEITDHLKKESLAPAEREKLISAMDDFNKVVAEFSPHDRLLSSRKRLFDDLIPKYGLQDHFQRRSYPRTLVYDFPNSEALAQIEG